MPRQRLSCFERVQDRQQLRFRCGAASPTPGPRNHFEDACRDSYQFAGSFRTLLPNSKSVVKVYSSIGECRSSNSYNFHSLSAGTKPRPGWERWSTLPGTQPPSCFISREAMHRLRCCVRPRSLSVVLVRCQLLYLVCVAKVDLI